MFLNDCTCCQIVQQPCLEGCRDYSDDYKLRSMSLWEEGQKVSQVLFTEIDPTISHVWPRQRHIHVYTQTVTQKSMRAHYKALVILSSLAVRL